jgi:hypothetical protein
MRLGFGTLACLLALFSSAYPCPGANPPFSLTLHAPTGSLRIGSEIHLTVTVTNISDHEFNFGVAPSTVPDMTMSYSIEIRDAKGYQPSPTPLLRDLREHPKPPSGSIFGYAIAPGKSYDEKLEITRLYVLTPGRYTMQVAGSQKPWPDPADAVKSNVITINLVK